MGTRNKHRNATNAHTIRTANKKTSAINCPVIGFELASCFDPASPLDSWHGLDTLCPLNPKFHSLSILLPELHTYA